MQQSGQQAVAAPLIIAGIELEHFIVMSDCRVDASQFRRQRANSAARLHVRPRLGDFPEVSGEFPKASRPKLLGCGRYGVFEERQFLFGSRQARFARMKYASAQSGQISRACRASAACRCGSCVSKA